mgnify:CR=1 FL=1
MILARILTPQDFGLIAMVVAVTGFILVFKNLGLSMATVQKAEINHGQVSTLFWINVAMSFALMLLTMALAPAVAWFYKEPRLLWVTIALASAFIFGGLAVQHQALLRRQMRFTALAVIDISSVAAGLTTGTICGLAGLGYWSLVLMHLATAITMTAGVWIASGWLPGPPVRRSGVREMLAFGGYLTGFGVVNYFSRNFDNVLIGRCCGTQPLGLYSRAYSLLLFPIGQITAPMTAVAIPALSRLQSEPERYRCFYLKAIKLIAYASMPLVAAMGVLSNEIVRLVLGAEWLDAGPIFMILALAAFWSPVAATVGWIYVSLNQTNRMFIWACIMTPLTILSFLIGLHWGVIGVSVSYSTVVTLQIVPQLWFALRHSPIKLTEVLFSLRYPFMASLFMAAMMFGVRAYIASFGVAWILIGSSLAGGVALSMLIVCVRSIRNDARDILDVGLLVFGRKTEL